MNTRRHILLTGEIQIGKSTAIRRFLAESGLTADGFMSHIADAANGRELYIARYDSKRGETERGLAARVRFPDFEVYAEVFDGLGAQIIKDAGQREIIVIDELGRMEEVCEVFKAAVFEKLGGSVPIVGVVKDADCAFLDAVRAHPNVEIITVTRENRDGIPSRILEGINVHSATAFKK
ncbi:MAG: nucleoside-triphosphatase [Oscillospiraceae bacterium]|jgi:nucleoside-triphosphatase|nr:nucleoside-triphosphatase [Oscillospiraceae bacterium]